MSDYHPQEITEPLRQRPEFRVFSIALFFGGVGPLAALACLIGIIFVESIVQLFHPAGHSFAQNMSQIKMFATVGIPFAYLYGLFPALGAGVLIGFLKLWLKYVRWYMALLIGVGVGILFAFSYQNDMIIGGPAGRLADYIFNILFCVVPTMICWAFVRNWFLDSEIN